MSCPETQIRPLSAEERVHFAWLRRPPVQKIAAALDAREPGGSRFVGGCVRDSLIGATPKDIDIATVLVPTEVIAALEGAGLSAAPTGLEHGTVTGIADHVGVEITTLRADVTTDGRRATVAFTRDWTIDAGRRDFRLNAIYLTFDGRLFDPVGGAEDARAGRVRFIGAAQDRIREDYLRILRFFRFSARFAQGFDAEGLGACAAEANGLSILSAERVGGELCRILDLPNAALAIDAMAASGVLDAVWPAPPDRTSLRRLKEAYPAAPAPLGLAALFGETGAFSAGENLDRALRLSNADGARRKKALQAAAALAAADTKGARAALYRFGGQAFEDGLMIAAARGAAVDVDKMREIARTNAPPAFPFSGRHVVALGIAPGPEVDAILKATEARWITEDFPSTERLQKLLEEVVAHRG
jgi:poly(A) polymerase